MKRLSDNDILILEGILNEKATIPQCSMDFKLIQEHFKNDKKITSHIIYTSLNRLNIFGFLEKQRWSRRLKYYITEDGINLLNMIQERID